METATASYTPAIARRDDYAPQSKVWVYIAARDLSEAEKQAAQAALDQFTAYWTAHNQALKACSEIVGNRYLLLMVDETQAGASGCSIDKSVHFLENLSRELGVDLFDRMLFGWLDEDQLRVTDRMEFAGLLQQGRVQADTPVVNSLAQTREDLVQRWLVPYAESWYTRIF